MWRFDPHKIPFQSVLVNGFVANFYTEEEIAYEAVRSNTLVSIIYMWPIPVGIFLKHLFENSYGNPVNSRRK